MKKIYQAGPWVNTADIKIVNKALSDWYEHPYDYVEAFQKEFAAYHGRKYGIMTPNCTTAIHLLLTCLGIKDGDEIIIPECTWIATVAPVTYLRATPIFADIEEVNWCLDPKSVEKSITQKTKAIIPVGVYGNMPLMDELLTLAKKYNLYLVEDAAEALGSTYKGEKAGSFGIGSVFSFHRTKTLTTGEGGMLLLDDKKLYEQCMIWRDHGRRPGGPLYWNYEVTYKYMPFNVQAALGYAQFQRFKELVGKKRWIFETYKKYLSGIEDIQLNTEPERGFNAVWDTTIIFGKSHQMTKKRAIEELASLGIPARPFFYPLSSLPAFPGMKKKYQLRNKTAYDLSDRGINLPCAMNLEENQIKFIAKGIKKILSKK